MGQTIATHCLRCGRGFTYNDGGGFTSHMVRCQCCGASKFIEFVELGELHVRYLKSFTGPYAIATAAFDDAARELPSGPPLPEAEYHAAVDAVAGRCGCGGAFSIQAPARCPSCRSTDIDRGEIEVLYD